MFTHAHSGSLTVVLGGRAKQLTKLFSQQEERVGEGASELLTDKERERERVNERDREGEPGNIQAASSDRMFGTSD